MQPTEKPITEAGLRAFAKAHFDAWNAHDVDACVARTIAPATPRVARTARQRAGWARE